MFTKYRARFTFRSADYPNATCQRGLRDDNDPAQSDRIVRLKKASHRTGDGGDITFTELFTERLDWARCLMMRMRELYEAVKWAPVPSSLNAFGRLYERAFKYGVLVAVIIAAWVAIKHLVLHIDPARAAIFDTVVFNAAGILGVFLGIRDEKARNGGVLSFGAGVKTGFFVALTYAVLTAIYFAVLL